MATWQQFTSIPNGTEVFNYGYSQCVALANLYHEDVIGGSFVPVPSAYMWWDHFWNYPTLTENYTRSNVAVPGAIFISRYGLYDAPNGHIGVVTSVNANGTFNTMEQNAGTWRYVGRYTRDYGNMLGFLVPKKNPATSVPAHSAVEKPKKKQRKNKTMFMVYYKSVPVGGGKRAPRWAVCGSKYWLELNTQAAASQIAQQLGIGSAFVCTGDAAWNKFKKASK